MRDGLSVGRPVVATDHPSRQQTGRRLHRTALRAGFPKGFFSRNRLGLRLHDAKHAHANRRFQVSASGMPNNVFYDSSSMNFKGVSGKQTGSA
jgi:hypothetical protein